VEAFVAGFLAGAFLAVALFVDALLAGVLFVVVLFVVALAVAGAIVAGARFVGGSPHAFAPESDSSTKNKIIKMVPTTGMNVSKTNHPERPMS